MTRASRFALDTKLMRAFWRSEVWLGLREPCTSTCLLYGSGPRCHACVDAGGVIFDASDLDRGWCLLRASLTKAAIALVAHGGFARTEASTGCCVAGEQAGAEECQTTGAMRRNVEIQHMAFNNKFTKHNLDYLRHGRKRC